MADSALSMLAQADFEPSPYQEDIFRFIRSGQGHGIVSAVAGSGKTTTLIQGARLLGAERPLFVAFNRHIAEALQGKLSGTGMEARTIHSLGNTAVYKALGRTRLDGHKYHKLAERRIDRLMPSLMQMGGSPLQMRTYVSYVAKVADLCRATLTETEEGVRQLSLDYSLAGESLTLSVEQKLLDLVLPLIEDGLREADRNSVIDFTDMIWLPIRMDLQLTQYDWLFCDEAQDLNAAQRTLVLRSCRPSGRMLFVGDPQQAIMAFAGADARSYWKIKEVTGATELPLSICYRCPASHISLAQRLVPQIQPRHNAPEGTIEHIADDKVMGAVKDGDLILCRTTAPLVSMCIMLIKNRVPARVRGRDIAEMLIKRARTILGEGLYADFPVLVETYREMQVAALERRKFPPQEQIDITNDMCDALLACYQSFPARSIEDLCAEISGIFSDERTSVWLSTIHRAKGLEAPRVFILRYDKLPKRHRSQSDDQAEQEDNLLYVALTRSKEALFLVNSPVQPE